MAILCAPVTCRLILQILNILIEYKVTFQLEDAKMYWFANFMLKKICVSHP